MSKELTNLGITLNENGFITSVDLVEIINYFRAIESTEEKQKAVLQHKSFMTKIAKELEVLESLGLGGEQNILPSSYINKQNKKQPCYLLNKDGMLMMLNSESTLVRYKTVEYINKLEKKLKQLQTPSYMIDDKIARAEKWIIEERQRQVLCEKVKKLQPKAVYCDNVLASDELLTSTQIAKEFGMSAYRFNQLMNELGVIYRQGKTWVVYKKYANEGLVKNYTTIKSGNSITYMKWTQAGRKFLHDILAKNGVYPIC